MKPISSVEKINPINVGNNKILELDESNKENNKENNTDTNTENQSVCILSCCSWYFCSICLLSLFENN